MGQKRKNEFGDDVEPSESDGDLDDPNGEQYEENEEGGIWIDEVYIPPPPKNIHMHDANTPRLIIKNIINTNFKSYGGEQLLGPFHKVFF